MDIRQVASRAKVSTATVSRTINHIPTVDPQLAKRVWRVVEELGYYPNSAARSLGSGRSHVFGLIVSEITNPFFPEIVQTFENLAVEHNYEILLTSTIYDSKRMELAVRRMIERRVDGVAILTFGMEDTLIEDLHFRKVPLVFVDVGPDLPRVSNISINYKNGIRQAVQHLAALRHTRIAFIAGPLYLKSAVARHEAFQESMKEIGLDPSLISVGNHTVEGGMTSFRELWQRRILPTAVLCSNDMTAIGVMREAYQHGIEIPRNLSVVGFDDIRLAQFVIPPLTSVQMSQQELARIAFHALMKDMERAVPSQGRTEYVMNTTLVLRDSTALAPKSSASRKTRR